jgi:hypothetical protein
MLNMLVTMTLVVLICQLDTPPRLSRSQINYMEGEMREEERGAGRR